MKWKQNGKIVSCACLMSILVKVNCEKNCQNFNKLTEEYLNWSLAHFKIPLVFQWFSICVYNLLALMIDDGFMGGLRVLKKKLQLCCSHAKGPNMPCGHSGQRTWRTLRCRCWVYVRRLVRYACHCLLLHGFNWICLPWQGSFQEKSAREVGNTHDYHKMCL